jgi:tetratricopeptide (TPR) repeat protein
MALVPLANDHPGDVPALLARALELAGNDADRKLVVARTAIQYGQQGYAQSIIEPLVKASPTRELYQLAAQLAQGQGRIGDALAYLEKAQEAGADEPVDLATVRGELSQIIALAQQLAVQARGAARAQAVERALAWANRWRLVDPGNGDIDRQLGNLLLAIGDSAGAWRQLSSTIERDPWSSTGYTTVADAFERQGKIGEALELWQQAIVIDQTNPTPRLRKAQALIALGRTAEGEALLEQIANGKWHDMWNGVVYQAKDLIRRGKPTIR